MKFFSKKDKTESTGLTSAEAANASAGGSSVAADPPIAAMASGRPELGATKIGNNVSGVAHKKGRGAITAGHAGDALASRKR